MVVSPKNTRELSKEDKKEVKRLEQKIDQMLLEGERTMEVSIFSNEKVRQKIVSLYTTAGWYVEYKYDQREGDYLNFLDYRPIPNCYDPRS